VENAKNYQEREKNTRGCILFKYARLEHTEHIKAPVLFGTLFGNLGEQKSVTEQMKQSPQKNSRFEL
jgi:hypothetical protein